MDPVKHKSKKKSKETEELEHKVLVLEDQLRRAVADYRNLEKRAEEEKKKTVKFANRELLLRLISALDTLFIAEKYIEDDGLKITIKHIKDVLEDVGVKRIETEGREFDPTLMECVETVDGKENTVIGETRPGFMLYDKLLKPAQVKVGKVATSH